MAENDVPKSQITKPVFYNTQTT